MSKNLQAFGGFLIFLTVYAVLALIYYYLSRYTLKSMNLDNNSTQAYGMIFIWGLLVYYVGIWIVTQSYAFIVKLSYDNGFINMNKVCESAHAYITQSKDVDEIKDYEKICLNK